MIWFHNFSLKFCHSRMLTNLHTPNTDFLMFCENRCSTIQVIKQVLDQTNRYSNGQNFLTGLYMPVHTKRTEVHVPAIVLQSSVNQYLPFPHSCRAVDIASRSYQTSARLHHPVPHSHYWPSPERP